MTDSVGEEPIGVTGMERLQEAWAAVQRGETLSPSAPDMRAEIDEIKERLGKLELRVSRIPGRVFDHPRR